MNTPQSQITSLDDLKAAPRFLLRADFPEENGWLDAMRVPLSPEQFAQAPERHYATYEQYLERLAKSEPAPFMGYWSEFTGVRPWETRCLLRDGVHTLVVEYEGLFADLCSRVNAALRLPAAQRCPIRPYPKRGLPPDELNAPDYFVYHDREHSTAYVVPWKMKNNMRWLPWLPR